MDKDPSPPEGPSAQTRDSEAPPETERDELFRALWGAEHGNSAPSPPERGTARFASGDGQPPEDERSARLDNRRADLRASLDEQVATLVGIRERLAQLDSLSDRVAELESVSERVARLESVSERLPIESIGDRVAKLEEEVPSLAADLAGAVRRLERARKVAEGLVLHARALIETVEDIPGALEDHQPEPPTSTPE